MDGVTDLGREMATAAKWPMLNMALNPGSYTSMILATPSMPGGWPSTQKMVPRQVTKSVSTQVISPSATFLFGCTITKTVKVRTEECTHQGV